MISQLLCVLSLMIVVYPNVPIQYRNPNASQIKYVTRFWDNTNGLPVNTVFKTIQDERGYLWAVTEEGCNGKPIPVRLFDSTDGMANNEANGGFYPAGWKLKSGEIWFPTMEGIAKINPDQISETKNHLALHIKSLIYGEKEFFQGDKISIPPGIQDFRIHYSSIDFNHPKAIKYFYRLVGFQKSWQSADNRNVAYFTSLVPGKYTFEVKANQFGLESDTVSLDFIIEPFFYQTLLFKAFVLLVLFLAGILTRKLYTQRLMGKALVFQVDQQTKELQKRNNSLEAAFKEIEQQNLLLKEMTWVQSHELRGPVAVILGMSDILKNYEQFPKIQKSKVEIVAEIDKAASELDKLIRELNTKSDRIDEK